MVPSLIQLTTAKLLHNISSIQDTGITPIHLLLPILSRMNAKQLTLIETTSPQLTPDTDQLWYALIEKDFPTRPTPRSQRIKEDPMPNRTLYFKYIQEQESHRQDLTQRLRKITERLKLQKSANKIVKVPELLKDPTVRRRQFMRAPGGSGGSRYTNPKKNSILLKARRETLSRTMMFPKLKVYDPFQEYKMARDMVVCDPRQNPNNRAIENELKVSSGPRNSNSGTRNINPGPRNSSTGPRNINSIPTITTNPSSLPKYSPGGPQRLSPLPLSPQQSQNLSLQNYNLGNFTRYTSPSGPTVPAGRSVRELRGQSSRATSRDYVARSCSPEPDSSTSNPGLGNSQRATFMTTHRSTSMARQNQPSLDIAKVRETTLGGETSTSNLSSPQRSTLAGQSVIPSSPSSPLRNSPQRLANFSQGFANSSLALSNPSRALSNSSLSLPNSSQGLATTSTACSDSTAARSDTTASTNHDIPPPSPPILRKRRPPSIFLTRNKRPGPSKKKSTPRTTEKDLEPQTRIKLIKSSVFQ